MLWIEIDHSTGFHRNESNYAVMSGPVDSLVT